MTQTLDERQADEGKLVLEVKATGTGLIPNLDELLDVESPGFKVESVEDQGLSVTRFDPESEDNAVNSERLWLVNYTPAVSAQKMPKEYSFGETVLDTQETVFQRYNDADLVTVAQVIDLEEQYGKQSYWWLIGLIGVVGIAGCCAIGIIIFMPKRTVALTQEHIQVPDNLTPFSVLALLEEIGQRSRFDEASQRELSDAMNRLEESYFGDANGEARPDLQVVAKEWLTRYSRQ